MRGRSSFWFLMIAGDLLVAGIVLVIIGDDTLDVVGFVCLGAGLIALTSWAFYAIGRSEDRARERETNPLA